MGEELHQDPKINRNTDMNLSAYLVYCGFEFIGLELPGTSEKDRYSDKLVFMFKYSEVMKQKKDEYFQGTGLVEPKKYCSCRNFLRKRIQEMQAGK